MFLVESKVQNEKQEENPKLPYFQMDVLYDKLKILNYEVELVNMKMNPIHRYYFAVIKNPGEQFYLFTSLASWLIRKTGRVFEQPQESDDPNTTISNILDVLRDYGIIVDFSPSKLKQGVGEQVIFVLDSLANQALNKVGYKYKTVVPPHEPEDEVEDIEEDAEIILDKVEEEMLAYYSDESDDENVFHISDLPTKKQERNFELTSGNVDEESWKLELERVLPQLKVTVRSDGHDWRSHLDQMKNLRNTMEESFGGTKNQLEKMHKDISTALDKIANREKYLNRDLEPVLEEYRLLQDQLSKVKDTYKSISVGVTERNRELARLTDTLDIIKQQMEERGSSMTDGTPLVNIKKAITKIKSEITEMDVRIGVLECTLLQAKLREKNMLDEDLRQSVNIF